MPTGNMLPTLGRTQLPPEFLPADIERRVESDPQHRPGRQLDVLAFRGLPVGAYGGRADLMELVSPAGPVYQAGTLSGNPLAMTAGLWSLEQLTPKLYADLETLGVRLAAGLADAARDAGVPLQVNQVGSLVTPFFTTRPVRDYESAVSASTDQYAHFFRCMITRGIYPPPSQFEAWFLSAAHTTRDVDKTIRAARAALKEVARGR